MANDTLAAALVAASGRYEFRKGVVVSAPPSPFTIMLGGNVSPVTSRLASYTPSPDEVVLVLVTESAVVVLGKLV